MQVKDSGRKTRGRLSVGLRLQVVACLVTMCFLALVAFAIQPPDAAYAKDFDKWKAELVDDLKQNWLPLAGLFWLKAGDNVFGSGNDNPIVLPSGPAKAGRFMRQGDDVTVEFESGVEAKVEGKVVKTAKLQADVSG